MSALTYDALVAHLFPRLTGGIRWGLERTLRLLASVGDPHRSFRSVHIGGTNGKGSVAAHVDAIVRASGRRVGLYTSPHLCTFRERIRLDGRAIDERALLRAAERLWPAVEREEPSFFEATTALAFLALADAGVDVAVVEVGLGGRLDSTNVIDPDAVVLTNVSLDHVQLLGPTVEAVAREKAGIIKPGVPVVTGEAEGAAAEVFARTALERQAPLRVVRAEELHGVATTRAGTRVVVAGTGWGDVELVTPLAGSHQAMNVALAVHVLDACPALRPTRDQVVTGVEHVVWAGRLQIERVAGIDWVFDVAHNVAGVDALVAALRELDLRRPVVGLVGVLGDKDWRNMLAPLHAALDGVVLTAPPTAPADRRWDPAEALAAAPSSAAEIVLDFTPALERAAARAGGGTVVVTGSFHTVGDALAALGLCVDGSDIAVERPSLAFTQ